MRPRRLTRTPDGKVAGVCAGVGHYLGIDPVLVRIVVVALTLAGGSGLIAYVIAAVIIPKAAPGEPLEPVTDGLRSASTATIAGVVGLALGATLLFGGRPFGGPIDNLVPLLLVAGGIALLMQRRDPTTDAHPGGAAGATGPAGSTFSDDPTLPSPTFTEDWTSTWFAPGQAGAPGWSAAPGGAAGSAPMGETTAPVASSVGVLPGRRRQRPLPDRRFPFTLLTVSVLAVLGGVALVAERLGWADPSWPGAFAAALLVIGAVLVVAAFVGRARLLVLLGLLCALGLGLSSVTADWADDGVGDRTVRPTLATLDDVQRHGIGHFVVDVRALELVEGTRTLTVRLGVGEAEILVPDDLDVELLGQVGVGAITGPDDVTDGGLDTVNRRSYPAPSADGGSNTIDEPRLVVDVEVGVGAVVVRRG